MGGKNIFFDFHIHSNFSDGLADIETIIKEAKKRPTMALALTDHNTGEGVKAFATACYQEGITSLEGVEIYIAFPKNDWSENPAYCGSTPDAVILGRELNWGIFEETYREPLKKYWATEWLPQTLEKLTTLGFAVPQLNKAEIQRQVKSGVPQVLQDIPSDPKNWSLLFEITRQYEQYEPNISMDSISKNPVYFAGMYLCGVGKPAYVPRIFPSWTVASAAQLAEEMGGVLFAAHPGGNYANWSREHLDYFVANGGKGIEVWQYHHKPDQIDFFLRYAREHNLTMSGGSDWHGENANRALCCWDKPENQIPEWAVQQLFERLP